MQTKMVQTQQQSFGPPNLEMPATDISGVLMTPLWIDGRLILARRITAEGKEYVQGCLLDWPVVKRSLLETIADLLPGADPAAGDRRRPARTSRGCLLRCRCGWCWENRATATASPLRRS